VKQYSPLRTVLSLFFLNIAVAQSLSAQSSLPDSAWLNDAWYFSDASDPLTDPTLFLPPLLKNDALMKRYLRDDRFFELRKQYDDTLAVDAIFDHAMMIADGDIRSALLLSMFAVMDHRQLGLKVPVFGSMYFPLTAENDSLFRIRRTHLPKKVLNDNLRASDKDKLQHFFGSAFLAYATNSNAFALFIGDLFEIGEDEFVLGGRSDDRDKLANAHGRSFGLGLRKDADLLPSDILWGRR
jgi:hypothetical protein